MSFITNKKESNKACLGCCNSCKNKKIENNAKLFPINVQKSSDIKYDK